MHTLIDKAHPQRRRTMRTEEAFVAVEYIIEEVSKESIFHLA